MFKLIVLDPLTRSAGWRCIVKRGAFTTLTSVRAATRADAIRDAVKQARYVIREERDERARLALQASAAKAAMTALAGYSAPVADVRAATDAPLVHALCDWFTSPR